MPKLIRLYIRCCLIGFALSACFVAALLWQDVAGLRGLIFGSSAGLLALVMLLVFNGIVTSGVYFAITIMGMAQEDGPSGGKRDALPLAEPAMVPVRPRR